MAFRLSVILSVLLIALGSAAQALPPLYIQDSAQSAIRAATKVKQDHPDRHVAVVLDVDETLVVAESSDPWAWSPIFQPGTFVADYISAITERVDFFFCSCGRKTNTKLLQAYGLAVYQGKIIEGHSENASKWDFYHDLWVHYQIGLTSDPVSIFFVDNRLDKVMAFGKQALENPIAPSAQLVLVWFDTGSLLDPLMKKRDDDDDGDVKQRRMRLRRWRRNSEPFQPLFRRGGIPKIDALEHSWRLYLATGGYEGTLDNRLARYSAAVRAASAEPLKREVLSALEQPTPRRRTTWAKIHRFWTCLWPEQESEDSVAECWPEQELGSQFGAAGVPMDLVPIR